jgi:hypothetical protein
MMEAQTVSEMLESNATLTWLAAREGLFVFLYLTTLYQMHVI